MTDEELSKRLDIVHAGMNDNFLCVSSLGNLLTQGQSYKVIGMSFGDPVIHADTGQSLVFNYTMVDHLNLIARTDAQ